MPKPPAFLRRLRRDRRGNIMVLMAMAMIPLTFAVGFGIDYSRAQKMQTQLNAIADTAALGAVDPAMLCQSSDTAKAAALAMFNAQAANLSDLASVTPTVTINPANSAAGCSGTRRTVTVAWTAKVRNVFSAVLGSQTLAITGSASSDASQPPSINFTVALDISPSMLLPTTTTGIANLKNGVIWNGAGAFGWPVVGCDFACHSVNSHSWNYGNFVRDANGNAIYTTSFNGGTMYRLQCSTGNVYNQAQTQIGYAGYTSANASACGGNFYNNGSSGSSNPITLYYKPMGSFYYTSVSVNYPDSWWLAENYQTVNPGSSAITLRLDAESPAAQNLVTYARNTELQYSSAPTPPVYKMQFYTFAYGNAQTVSSSPWNSMTDVANSYSSTFPSLTTNAPLMQGIGCWTSSCPGSNAFTDITALLSTMQSALPSSAGTGTVSNPQNVLIILTDGAADSANDGLSAFTSNNIATCNAIKNSGTKIAILYTVYDPNTINYTAHPTFNTFASNQVPSILSQLQACSTQNADGTYLVQTVGTDGDISGGLTALFQTVVQSSRLVQ